LGRILLLTGLPGVGKTTVVETAVKELVAKGFKVGGMITREVRKGGIRIGFQIEDLTTGRLGWLAHIDQAHGPRIGRYRVNQSDLEEVGVKAILEATIRANAIAIDEIGPMELTSESFKDSVTKALESGKVLLGTIHLRVRDPLIEAVEKRSDVEIREVTVENRDELPKLIVQKIADMLNEEC